MNASRLTARLSITVVVPVAALALITPHAGAATQPEPTTSAVAPETSDFTDSSDPSDMVDSTPPKQYYSTPPTTNLPSVDGTDEASTTPSKAASVDYFNCVLHPSVVHKRKSGSYNTVGAKPYTKCSAGVASTITHSSTLYKARWLGLSWQSMDSKSQTGHNTATLTLKTVSWTCQNSNNSNFLQSTSGSATEAGHTFYSSVSTSKVSLTCGN